MNCEFQVIRDGNELGFFDGYAQEIIGTTSTTYASNFNDYDVKIIEIIIIKICMQYIAEYWSETKYDREIIVWENINQIIFKYNFKKIYPYSDHLVLHVYVIDKAFYKINVITVDKYITETTVTRI